MATGAASRTAGVAFVRGLDSPGQRPTLPDASHRPTPRPTATATSPAAGCSQRHRLAAADVQHRRAAQDLDHPLDERAVRVRRSAPESSTPSPSQSTGVGIVASTTNGPGHADDLVVDLRPVDQDFFVRRLVVGDALERDVRDDAADFFALLVLLALVDEAAGRPARSSFSS